MNDNPWMKAWRQEPDDTALDSIVERRAIPIDTTGKAANEIAQSFVDAAAEIFLCDAQSRKVLRQILDVGRCHATHNYLSLEQFEVRVSSREPWSLVRDAAFAVTGAAGVGKTRLVAAAVRLMASRHAHIDGITLSGIPLTPLWTAKIRNAGSIGDVLEQLLGLSSCAITSVPRDASGWDGARQPSSKRVVSSLRERVRTRSYRDGVAAIVLDELQFGSRGDACAWITSLLLQLLGYGPIVFYVMNYSLAHKLWDRPPEDRRRLLSNVIEVHPFRRADDEWIRFLRELMRLLPGAWDFDCKQEAQEILRFTYGIRDNAVELIKVALMSARASDPVAKVKMSDISRAYRSEAYSTRREDVEKLLANSESLKKRSDLYSPFRARAAGRGESNDPTEVPQSQPATAPGAAPAVGSNVVVATEAIAAHQVRILDAMHVEQLPPTQRREIELRTKRTRSSTQPPNVVPIRRGKSGHALDDVIGAAADLMGTK